MLNTPPIDFSLPGYRILERFCEGVGHVIYRGLRDLDRQPVLLKIIPTEHLTYQSIHQLKYEHEVSQKLRLPGLVQALEIDLGQPSPVLILEDRGGKPLKWWIQQGCLTLAATLQIMLQVVETLGKLHEHDVIHRSISPSNILVNLETGHVQLIDLGVNPALQFARGVTEFAATLGESLAYLAPEQMGRLNRTVDYRVDFYAMGVTLYEVLTGRRPFESLDPIELVHAHLAKQPQPPQTLNRNIPTPLAAIVLKLLAKSAEDRYQSAYGLRADLKQCLMQLRTTGTIADFALAQQDVASQFRPSHKLYGRAAELEAIAQAFQRTSEGRTELLWVTGPAGVGKSFLVHELQRSIWHKRGYFLAGKFDEFRQDIPYVSLIQAFQGLVRQILTESDQQVQYWRDRLLQTIGANGQVLIEVLPEMAMILGDQPALPRLGAIEAQNRFHLVLQQFIRVFAQPEHPLVIFLDDLQWADVASLKLIHLLATDVEQQALLLIGAYREQEITSAHALSLTLRTVQATPGTHTSTIAVRSLDLPQTAQLIADSLGHAPQDIDALAHLIFNRTQGNPFFTHQLLEFLYEEKLIAFDFDRGGWNWDLDRIQTLGITQNVLDLMISKIRRLPEETQQILKIAACLGSEFNLATLATVSEYPTQRLVPHLWEALREGLLLTVAPGTVRSLDWENWLLREEPESTMFRFLHDRVQLAAYSLIPVGERQALHLRAGQASLRQMLSLQQEEQLFDVVNQLNAGRSLLQTPQDRWQLAHLNLGAGKKAKAAAAYELALKYFETGLSLTPSDAWAQDYELTFELFTERLECEYLCGDWEAAEQSFRTVVCHAQNQIDRAAVYSIQMALYLSQSRREAAIDLGREGLRLLGEAVPDPLLAPGLHQIWESVKTLVGQQAIDLLSELSRDTENSPHHQIMNLLQYLAAASVTTDLQLYQWAILTMVRRSLLCGNTENSAYAYVAYGTMLITHFGDYEAGHAFGRVALQISEQFNSLRGTTQFSFWGLLAHWKIPLSRCREHLFKAFQQCCETGEFLYALYSLVLQADAALSSGACLESCDRDIRQLKEFASLRHHSTFLNDALIKQQFVGSLRGTTLRLGSFSDAAVEEADLLDRLQQPTEPENTLSRYYIYKLQSLYLLGQYGEAQIMAAASARLVDRHLGVVIEVEHYFYATLLLTAIYPEASASEKPQLWQQIEQHLAKLQRWATYSPENFQHRLHLVLAEMARLQGEDAIATSFYDRAMTEAQAQACYLIEAIACELAAKYHLSQQRSRLAQSYFRDACTLYSHWGATAKVNLLRHQIAQRFETQAGLRNPLPLGALDRNFVEPAMAEPTTHPMYTLDWMTVIKASQALSSEIVFSSLMEKLMKIVIENAGAERGLLIVRQGSRFVVEAAGHVHQINAQGEAVAEADRGFPLTLIAYVERMQETVVLNHALRDGRFQTDPYLQAHRTKSVLCFPIVYQGKLTAILYLENNLTVGAFTPDHLEVLKLLTAQVAISIENANLYSNLQQHSQTLEQQNAALARSQAQLQERTSQLEQAFHNLQQTQAQLVQTEKLSSLGQLIAGVAHEIKNPLNFIAGNISYAKVYLDRLLDLLNLYQAEYPTPTATIQSQIEAIDLPFVVEDLEKLLTSMEMGTERIHNLVMSLRNFSRTDEQEMQLLDLQEGLESTLLILRPRLKATPARPSIVLEKHYGETPLVECYPSQLSQVFMNLIANAIDAIDELCETRTFEENQADRRSIRIWTEVVQDDWVAIHIRDTGAGMTEETRSRLFETFFTTKPTGQGTGLGLSISKQIVVEKHSGILECVSTLGEGAEFIVKIPVRQDPLRASKAGSPN